MPESKRHIESDEVAAKLIIWYEGLNRLSILTCEICCPDSRNVGDLGSGISMRENVSHSQTSPLDEVSRLFDMAAKRSYSQDSRIGRDPPLWVYGNPYGT